MKITRLPKKTDLYWYDYENAKDKLAKYFDEYEKLNIMQILQKLAELEDNPSYEKEGSPYLTAEYRYKIEAATLAIITKLGVLSRKVIMDSYEIFSNDILEGINDLEKSFKNHRHDTSKLYTEKPAW